MHILCYYTFMSATDLFTFRKVYVLKKITGNFITVFFLSDTFLSKKLFFLEISLNKIFGWIFVYCGQLGGFFYEWTSNMYILKSNLLVLLWFFFLTRVDYHKREQVILVTAGFLNLGNYESQNITIMSVAIAHLTLWTNLVTIFRTDKNVLF